MTVNIRLIKVIFLALIVNLVLFNAHRVFAFAPFTDGLGGIGPAYHSGQYFTNLSDTSPTAITPFYVVGRGSGYQHPSLNADIWLKSSFVGTSISVIIRNAGAQCHNFVGTPGFTGPDYNGGVNSTVQPRAQFEIDGLAGKIGAIRNGGGGCNDITMNVNLTTDAPITVPAINTTDGIYNRYYKVLVTMPAGAQGENSFRIDPNVGIVSIDTGQSWGVGFRAAPSDNTTNTGVGSGDLNQFSATGTGNGRIFDAEFLFGASCTQSASTLPSSMTYYDPDAIWPTDPGGVSSDFGRIWNPTISFDVYSQPRTDAVTSATWRYESTPSLSNAELRKISANGSKSISFTFDKYRRYVIRFNNIGVHNTIKLKLGAGLKQIYGNEMDCNAPPTGSYYGSGALAPRCDVNNIYLNGWASDLDSNATNLSVNTWFDALIPAGANAGPTVIAGNTVTGGTHPGQEFIVTLPRSGYASLFTGNHIAYMSANGVDSTGVADGLNMIAPFPNTSFNFTSNTTCNPPNNPPIGSIDSITVSAACTSGGISANVTGFAADPDTVSALVVTLTIDGVALAAQTANLVPLSARSVAGNHDFKIPIPAVYLIPSSTHSVTGTIAGKNSSGTADNIDGIFNIVSFTVPADCPIVNSAAFDSFTYRGAASRFADENDYTCMAFVGPKWKITGLTTPSTGLDFKLQYVDAGAIATPGLPFITGIYNGTQYIDPYSLSSQMTVTLSPFKAYTVNVFQSDGITPMNNASGSPVSISIPAGQCARVDATCPLSPEFGDPASAIVPTINFRMQNHSGFSVTAAAAKYKVKIYTPPGSGVTINSPVPPIITWIGINSATRTAPDPTSPYFNLTNIVKFNNPAVNNTGGSTELTAATSGMVISVAYYGEIDAMIYDSADNPLMTRPVVCTIGPQTRPYTKVFYGDVSVGGGFKTSTSSSCTSASAGIIKTFGTYLPAVYPPTSITGRYGSSVDFSARATNTIFGDIAGRHGLFSAMTIPLTNSGLSSTPSYLSLSNGLTATTWGGSFAASHCIDDYYTQTQDSPSPISSPTVLNSLSDGQYSYSGNLTINPTTTPLTSRITIYVDGDAYITGNINLLSAGLDPHINIAGGKSNNTVPYFSLVVRGNIYVDDIVNNIDGFFVAQPTLADNSGRFMSCSKFNGVSYVAPDISIYSEPTAGTFTASPSIVGRCSRLVVNGAVVAKRLTLNRVNGLSTLNHLMATNLALPAPFVQSTTLEKSSLEVTATKANLAAEEFNFTPEMVVGQPNFLGATPVQDGVGNMAIQSLFTLPPIY